MTPTTLTVGMDDLVRLRPGVSSARTADGEVYLLAWPHGRSVGRLTADQQRLLRGLAGPARTAQQLSAPDPQGAGELLERLRAGGWLVVTAVHDGRRRYTLTPDRPPSSPPGPAPSDLVLSRFAVLSRSEDRLVLASPRSWCEVEVHDPAALPVACGLDAPADLLPAAVAGRLRHDLWSAGLLVQPSVVEHTDFAARQWSPHELWFHDQSRLGRRHLGDRYGATFWARGTFDPLPAVRDPFPGPVVGLRRPDLTALRHDDPTLTSALEDRRSIREHDDADPLTVDQLGEFLYRCARNRATMAHDGVEYVSRPYPCGGGGYELELYPVVRHVAGLEPGMYRYAPDDHRLELVCGPNPALRRLLATAALTAGTTNQPQVLIVVAARFGRVMWKYQAMAYSLILKHVGVLSQVMYLVATAMGLAPCALGGGDSAAFAGATGIEELEEASVGEFILGSRAVRPQDPEAAG